MKLKDDIKVDVITCPKCGREYLPAEIYYPNHFFGRPSDIERTKQGAIDEFYGTTMNTTETFTCENCNTKFRVTATVKFKTEEMSSAKLADAYVTNLFEDKIRLNENF